MYEQSLRELPGLLRSSGDGREKASAGGDTLPYLRGEASVKPTLTAAQLKVICPNMDTARAAYVLGGLLPAMEEFEVNAAPRVAAFLAQFAHETGGFSTFEENLSYSTGRLMQVWPKRFKSSEEAEPFSHNPEALGSFVYANRMGNGPPETGDGWAFRGRGLCHLTGRENYRKAGKALGAPLESFPDLVSTRAYAYRVGSWFWASRGCNELADLGNFREITRVINGGGNGLADRLRYWERARLVLGVP